MKKIVFTILIFFIFSVFFIYYKNVEKKTDINITDAKMFEGEVLKVDKDNILVEYKSSDVDLVSQEEKEVKRDYNFFIDSRTVIYSLIEEIKSEDKFREEEEMYKSWHDQINEELNLSVFDYLFSPTWNEKEEISFSDIRVGDLLSIIYYENNDVLVAVKILRKIRPTTDNNELSFEEQIQIITEVMNLGEDYLVVKEINGATSLKEGENINVYLNKESMLEEKTVKSEVEFREEERIFREQMAKIKEEGGYSKILAPSWFIIKEISLGDISVGDKISLVLYKKDDQFIIKNLEKINN